MQSTGWLTGPWITLPSQPAYVHFNDLIKTRITQSPNTFFCFLIVYLDVSVIKHPKGPDLLGKAGGNSEGMAESLKEVVFALQEVPHIQNKVHELWCIRLKNCITINYSKYIFIWNGFEHNRRKGGVHCAPPRALLMYLNGYKCLNWHIVHMRHQDELQKSL